MSKKLDPKSTQKPTIKPVTKPIRKGELGKPINEGSGKHGKGQTLHPTSRPPKKES